MQSLSGGRGKITSQNLTFLQLILAQVPHRTAPDRAKKSFLLQSNFQINRPGCDHAGGASLCIIFFEYPVPPGPVVQSFINSTSTPRPCTILFIVTNSSSSRTFRLRIVTFLFRHEARYFFTIHSIFLAARSGRDACAFRAPLPSNASWIRFRAVSAFSVTTSQPPKRRR